MTDLKAETQKVKATISATKNATEQTVKVARENLTKGAEASRQQFEKFSDVAMQSFDQAARVNQDQFAAAAQATEHLAKAFETVSRQATVLAQKEVDAWLDTTRKVVDAKAIDDVLKVEADYMRERLNAFATDGVKLAEASFRVFREATEPVQKQIRTNVERAMSQVS